jgi:hypothetical protein
MHHPNRKYLNLCTFGIGDNERFARLDFFQCYTRNPRIGIGSETIRNTLAKVLYHIGFSVDWNIPKATERSKIIQSAYMVVMLMGNQHGIDGLEIVQANHLLAKIRTAINQYPHTVYFEQSRTTQTVVARVRTSTHGTSAPYFRHSRRGSAS